MEAKALVKVVEKQITSSVLERYMELKTIIDACEKEKEQLRKAILNTFPDQGSYHLGEFNINVKLEAGRRSFKFDDCQAIVTPKTWTEVYFPFVKIGDSVKKLFVIKD